MDRLKELPSESVHCVVTSPPYWGLRDYGTAQWKGGNSGCDHSTPRSRGDDIKNGDKQGTSKGSRPNTQMVCPCGAVRIDAQFGLEATPDEYVARLVGVFRELKRVLRDDATLWLNLGDSFSRARSLMSNRYARAGGWSNNNGLDGVKREESKRPRTNAPEGVVSQKLAYGLKEKDLVGIPWMIAFALRADGWYLRSDIIWSKPNSMPESVMDRPTKSHEYVFLLSKSARYYYDGDAIREPYSLTSISRYDAPNDAPMMGVAPTARQPGGDIDRREREKGLRSPNPLGRNARTVWTITTQPFSEAHFATFPARLVERCISAGTSERGVCRECGKPWARKIEKVEGVTHNREVAHVPNSCPTKVDSTGWQPSTRATNQWQQQCEHDAPVIPATVLDIFSGSGTTGVVANSLDRDYIGIELNPEYVAMSERRLFNPQPSFMDALRDEYDLQNQQGLTE